MNCAPEEFFPLSNDQFELFGIYSTAGRIVESEEWKNRVVDAPYLNQSSSTETYSQIFLLLWTENWRFSILGQFHVACIKSGEQLKNQSATTNKSKLLPMDELGREKQIVVLGKLQEKMFQR